MKFYHRTNEEAWGLIQKEGILWGVTQSYRYTYLAPGDSIHGPQFGNVLLEVEYNPVGINGMGIDNYGFNPPTGMTCWQFSVFIPIPICKVRRMTDEEVKTIDESSGVNHAITEYHSHAPIAQRQSVPATTAGKTWVRAPLGAQLFLLDSISETT